VRGSIRRITDTELEFGPMMGTKKLCPQMEIPNAFNRVIGTVTHYKIENRTLYFYNKNKNEVMQCLKVD
jgi:heat shock protein HslJ